MAFFQGGEGKCPVRPDTLNTVVSIVVIQFLTICAPLLIIWPFETEEEQNYDNKDKTMFTK